MELARLLAALSNALAYPHPVDRVEVHQTHISVVFLAGPFAYKVKKPIRLGFVDYSTLERRKAFCEQELAINRRLAPSVYRSIVPIRAHGERIAVEGDGEVVEWAVKMERLPESSTLRERVRRGDCSTADVVTLARRIAAFHASAASGPETADSGHFETVARNARENFLQSEAHVGLTVSRTVFDRLRELTERALTELKPLIEARAERGVPRDGHGDLRLDHVYRFPDRAPPEDLVVVDAIEFDTRLRAGDPVSDMAFLAMDLRCCGRPDLARAYCDAYFEASGDHEARALLPFYIGYRAAVRGKVEGIRANEPEVPEPERVAARMRARAYWVLALGALETPSRRPCLALVGGLPGTGKSTLSRNLSASAGFAIVRSDVVRKELAGSTSSTRAAFETGIYTAEWTDRTYAECLRRAEELLFEGGRVVIDATFRRERDRRAFLDAAQRWAVPAVFFVCQANSSIVRTRLENRHGDVSDADWSLSSSLAEHWEEPGTIVQSSTTLIETSVGRSAALAQALAALRLLDLAEAPVGVD